MNTEMIKLSLAQRFGGRRAIVPTSVSYDSTSKRRVITGYYLPQYSQYIKFYMYNPATHRTIAEEEGIDRPDPVIIRINSNCSIKEVEFDDPLKQLIMDTDQVDKYLAKPRQDGVFTS